MIPVDFWAESFGTCFFLSVVSVNSQSEEHSQMVTPAELKIPPQNLDAERGVLGSMLLLNECIDDVVEILQPDYFYNDAHKRIYSAIMGLHDQGVRGIDLVTLPEELIRRDELESVGGLGYVAGILEETPHAAHAEYYSKIVREKWIQRSLIYACTEILQKSYQPSSETEDLLALAEKNIFQLLEQQEEGSKVQIGDILMLAWERIEARMELGDEISGLKTGYTDFDEQTNGLQPSELVILAARPSMGKTAFVCNIAEAVAKNSGKGVLFFSLEQSKLELAERFLCIAARVNGHALRGGNLTDEEHEKLLRASSELSEVPLFIDDQPGRTISQIAALARRLHRQHKLGMIIIDYLQLIDPDDKNLPREQQIAQITRRLKFLAKEIYVPVIALAQLNRGVELREDKRPRLADLRESGAIEQDADLVMFLHRPDAYDPEDRPGEAEVIVAKHRSGPTGMVRLTWRKEFMRFEDYTNMQEADGGYFQGDDQF